MNRKQEYEKITQKLYDILKYTDISSKNPQAPKNGVDIDTVLWILKCDWPWIEIEDLQYIVSHCPRLGIYIFADGVNDLKLAKKKTGIFVVHAINGKKKYHQNGYTIQYLVQSGPISVNNSKKDFLLAYIASAISIFGCMRI